MVKRELSNTELEQAIEEIENHMLCLQEQLQEYGGNGPATKSIKAQMSRRYQELLGHEKVLRERSAD